MSVYLPTWPTNRVRRKAGRLTDGTGAPLVTAIPEHGRRVITAVNSAARRLGITPGITVTRDRSLAPELNVVDADPDGDPTACAAWRTVGG